MRVVPFFTRLQTRLTLLVAICVTVPAAAIALLCIDWTEDALIAAGRDRNRVVLDEIERLVAAELDEFEQILADIARRSAVVSVLKSIDKGLAPDPGAIRSLKQIKSTAPLCDRIFVLDKNSEVLVGETEGTTSAIQDLVAGTWGEGERVRYGKLVGNDGARNLLIATRVLTRPKNQVLGFAVVQTRAYELFRLAGATARALGSHTFSFALDDEGGVLMHSGFDRPPPDMMRGQLGEIIGAGSKTGPVAWAEVAINGDPHFYATRIAGRPGWRLFLATSASELLEPVQAGSRTVLVTAVIALVLALVAALLLSARLTRPITMLHKAVDNFARGEVSFVEVASVDEIGLLCQSYNQLLEDLIASQDTLELALAKTCERGSGQDERLATTNLKLRGALATILGLAEFLRDDAELVEVDVSDAIETAVSGLVSTLDEASGLSSAEFGDLAVDWAEFSPVKLVQDLARSMNTRASNGSPRVEIEFATPVPETLVGDARSIHRAIINVVGYVRDLAKDGTVTVRVEYDAEAADPLRIQVHGVNASDEDLEPLFQGFSKLNGAADSPSREGGTELTGLSISQRLARLHGGDLVLARTEQNENPHFCARFATLQSDGAKLIDVPDLPETAEPRPADPSTSTSVLSGYHVLCAEDSPGGFRLLHRTLERAGATVTSVENGAEVVDAALESSCDVVVLDLDKHDLDGHDTTARLRSAGYTNPIVALSAEIDASAGCQMSACDAYLVKPASRQALVAVVHEMVSRQLEANQEA